ncbi:MAG: DUF190 domain-containing protein [Gemmatimonadetes bacterium]|nr:MAG: DUF190 domain-containing protein [Gemmatimonadota bacterium]
MIHADHEILLRIFISETDTYHKKPLYEQIVIKAHELGIAGATVLRGLMGYGAGSRIHSAKVLRLSDDLPVVVELVDVEEKLNPLIPFLNDVVTEGLITMEKVTVIKYRKG